MMGKDEAVQKLSKVARISEAYAEDLYDSFFEKPVVPQYVADWYEGNKNEFEINLFQCIVEFVECYNKDLSSKFEDWLMDNDAERLATLINMHQLGYEVEKEKRYTVRIKGVNGYCEYLNKNLDNQRWFIASKSETEKYKTQHTRKELEEANFSWVFDCEGIEIEEVE